MNARVSKALALVSATVLGVGVLVLQAPAARADTSPPSGVLPTIAADNLPTWQVNGVVWRQAVTGNTVVAVGSFSRARPPGVGVGGAGEVAAANVFAFDITSGNRISSFNHQLNGQANSVAVSPNGNRIYIGGDFTTVDGQPRNHIAAFDTTSGFPLVAGFTPSVSGRVAALVATNSTVYAGGAFSTVNGQARGNIASFTAAGALTNWKAWATGGSVLAMTLTPDESRLIVGGSFTAMWNNPNMYGMASLDVVTGQLQPWVAPLTVRDAGSQGGINNLKTDGTQILGSGYTFTTDGSASFENVFGADPMTGNINFANDCHGDTTGIYPLDGVVYQVGHTHSCEWIGLFKNTNPWTPHYALAFTSTPSTVNTGPDDYGWNLAGVPASSVLHWFPDLSQGTYTGQGQAGWDITGNTNYVVAGGEFLTVNGGAQQGLTRFARATIAPNKRGPRVVPGITPSAFSPTAGVARIAWQSTYDTDNASLRYDLYRDNGANPVYSVTQSSNFWTLPSMGYRDTGLAPGSTHNYKLKVTDPFNNSTTSVNVPVTIASGVNGPYSTTVANDGATSYWRLGEASGSVGFDSIGFDDLTLGTGVGHGATGAIPADSDTASTFDGSSGSSAGFGATSGSIAGPDSFSLEAWIKTTTTSGGKILGFGNDNINDSGNYDRHLYMDNGGHVIFGVYHNGTYIIPSSKTYNDGQYHHLVGTLGPNGMAFYVDGKKVGANTGTTVGQSYNGFWRVGGDNLNGWPQQPSSNRFAGTIDDVAIYPTALTLTQVQKHWTDSGRTVAIPPPPSDAYGQAVYNAQPDLYWRLDETTGSTARDVSPNESDGTYYGGYTLGQASNVSGATGTAVRFDGGSGTMGSNTLYPGSNVFTTMAWFKTGSGSGGKIIGFGCAQSGTSGCYDRHIYMEPDGRLTFGVWTGQTNTTTSPLSYNDNKWHMVVGTQGPGGLKLYVDGAIVGTDPQTQAQPYDGYWRVGGDNTWNGSVWFNGTIDEVAVWNAATLSASQISDIFLASPAGPPNTAPVADIATPTCSFLACDFDGSDSSDPDGTVASYAWDFGGDGTSTQASPSHTFSAGGTYTVSLTVTDNRGAASTPKTVSVTVAPKPNDLPVADIATPTCSFLACDFDGSDSSDPDGTVASYAWDFGGDGTSTQASPSHTFSAGGTYTVSLTVTDNRGAASTPTTVSVTVAPKPNDLPVADIAATNCSYRTCTFDGSNSTDDGSIVGYAWDFGDGSGTSTAATPGPYTYTANGPFTVTLVVTDDKGATGTKTVSVDPHGNVAPTAVIPAPTCTSLSCMFSSAGSSDPEAAITSYAWDFGDSGTSTQQNPAHAYALAGTYTVALTVTDEKGATDMATRSVTVSQPAVLANDTFTRTVTNGWGTGELGGAWTVTGGAANFKVGGGFGSMTLAAPSSGPTATLASVSSATADVTVTETLDKPATGGGAYLYVTGRKVVGAGEYRGKVRITSAGAVYVAISRLASNSAETVIRSESLVSGLTFVPGQPIKIRFQVSGTGTTTLRLKAWAASGTEPAAWGSTVTDTTAALQTAGSVGLAGFLSGTATNAPVAIRVDEFVVTPVS